MPDSRRPASLAGCGDSREAGLPGPDEARALAHDLLATTQQECPGWNPPPFSPDLYARVLDIAVLRVDENSPWDAMYIPLRARPRIVLNTRNASAGRVNFSLAHEIAHSLLDPAPSGTRYFRARTDYYDGSVATLKLERACDEIAAELLMPGPWFREGLSRRGLCAEAVPVIAGDFGVSLEAAAARIVETTETPCAVGFFHYADPGGRTTCPPAASRAAPASEADHGSAWRTRRAFHSAGFPGRFRPAQAVAADSVLMTTALTGRPGSAVEAFKLGRTWVAVRVTTVAVGGFAGRQPRFVVGLFTLADPESPTRTRGKSWAPATWDRPWSVSAMEAPRFLVIDDEESICKLVVAVAESAGFTATAASSRSQIEKAITARFDLVVLDLSLGELDGIEVMSRLGAARPGVALILISGAHQSLLDTARRIAEMQHLRVVGTFAKPFSLDALKSAMSAWSRVADLALDRTGPRLLFDPNVLLDSDLLHLVYQPKVSPESGQMVGVEALVRWRHPEHGEVSPSLLVARIEEAARTGELLDVVMEMAARDRKRYGALACIPDVAINISALDLDDEELPRRAQRFLSRVSPAETWTFEVTETAPITEVAAAVAVLTRLRLAGFRLAVDDFGTGTSNYERLLVAPFTELKVDRALVGRLDSHVGDPDAMVRSSVEIGHSLGLRVIAEGVETAEQFRRVRALGCDAAQGYFIAPPVLPAQIDAALDGWYRNFSYLA